MEKKIEVVNNNGQLVVSSSQVAENFGKQHRDVLKAIRNLLEGMRKSSQTPMFYEWKNVGWGGRGYMDTVYTLKGIEYVRKSLKAIGYPLVK